VRGVRERQVQGRREQRGRWEGGGGGGRTPFFFVTIEPVGISVCGVWACIELYETEERVLR
jgi:hypothetical protein